MAVSGSAFYAERRRPTSRCEETCSFLAAKLSVVARGLLCAGDRVAEARADDARLAVDVAGGSRRGIDAAAGAAGAVVVLRSAANRGLAYSLDRPAAVGARLRTGGRLAGAGAVGARGGGHGPVGSRRPIDRGTLGWPRLGGVDAGGQFVRRLDAIGPRQSCAQFG